ncbi:MAG TPA: hypothetical protein VGP07_03820 [Polyangia bacterium]|jgi:hypothetical protein
MESTRSRILTTFTAVMLCACGTKYADPIRALPAMTDAAVEVGGAAIDADDQLDGDAGPPPDAAPSSQANANVALPTYCTSDGWCGATPNYPSLWAAAPNDIWMAAAEPESALFQEPLLHFDGAHWTAFPRVDDVQGDLRAIWGTSSSDVWAAGSLFSFFHWDGDQWSAVPFTAFTGAGPFSFNALWGSGPDDVWAVGDLGAIAHWDGAIWAIRSYHQSPSSYEPVEQPLLQIAANLSGVWGSSAHDLWVVGDAGAIFHGDGDTWTQMQDAAGGTPTLADLAGIWGAAADDVWAVGASGVVLHFQGKEWTVVDVPTTENLKAIGGTGPDDIWIAGDNGALLHRTATGWYVSAPKTSSTLRALWMNEGELWAVGDDAAAIHWASGTWLATQPPAVTADLTAVSALGANAAWAVGAAGTMLSWDGTSWSQVPSGSTADYRGLWTNQDSNVWAVGTNGAIVSRAHQAPFDTTAWVLPTPDRPDFNTVWGFGVDEVYVGGTGGTLLHYHLGQGWTVVPSGTTDDILSLWGTGPSDLWEVTTQADAVLHWDGNAWSPVTALSEGTWAEMWRGVFGAPTGEAYLLGPRSAARGPDGATLRQLDGGQWDLLPPNLPFQGSVLSGWTNGPGTLWTVGDYPGAFQWDGIAWSQSATGVTYSLTGISGTTSGDLWAVGQHGTILHKQIPSAAVVH